MRFATVYGSRRDHAWVHLGGWTGWVRPG